VLQIDPGDIGPEYPVLRTLVNSFWKFKNAFIATGKNFFESKIGGNPRLINNRREKTPIKISDICLTLILTAC
jgi:hypothetical protein